MGSKPSSQQQTSQSQTTTADPQAAADYTNAINRARQAANTPYQAYSGQLTAPINSQEQLATNALNGLGAASTGYFNTASAQSGLGAAAVNPTAVNGSAISQYMSPYQQQVVDATTAEINNQNAQQQQQLKGNAISAGAFGGDRAGIASAALANQQDLAENQTIANLNSQNYTQALGEANTQQSVGLGAAQANRAAVQQNAALQAGLGSAVASAGTGIAGAQLGAGVLGQQTQQAADTAAYQQFEQALAYPFQTSQFYTNAVEGIAPNYGSSTSGTGTTQTDTSSLNSILGGGLGLAALLSDRRAKEDLRPVGRTFDGQTIYSFRYKGEPTTHVGLIAQEVEKRNPNAVGHLGDAKIVDYAEATRKAADKGRFAFGGPVNALGNLGSVPYTEAGEESYVPLTGTGGPARMLSAPMSMNLGGQQQTGSTGSLPNFSSYIQAGKGLQNTSFGDSVSDFMQDAFASGGKVAGLERARMRRGYDDGGTVGTDGLFFDPNAVGPSSAFQPGVGAGTMPDAFVPPPTQGLGAASAPAALPPSNDNTPTPGLGTASTASASPPVSMVNPVVLGPAGTLGDASSASAASAPTDGVAAINAATQPRSIRNNNPGNIIDGSYAQGLPGYAGSDGRFAKFDSPQAGASAMDGLLAHYGSNGLDTPFSIVSKWAPAGDGNNNPVAYASSVAKQLGIGVNDKIDMTDPTQRAALAHAMANVEAGTGPAVSATSNALGYTANSLGAASAAGAKAASDSLGLGGADTSQPQKLSDYFGTMIGGTGHPTAGHSGGVLGLFPGVSDNARLALAAAGFGMAASPSMSPGVALGQGGLQGVKTFLEGQNLQRQSDIARAQLANTASEIATRQGELSLGNRRADIASDQFKRQLEQTQKQLSLESQRVANNTALTKSETAEQGARTVTALQTPTPQGILVRDPNNPSAPPKLVPYTTLQSHTTDASGALSSQSPSTPSVVDPNGYVHPPSQVPINSMLFSQEGRAAASKNSEATMDGARTAYESSQSMKLNLDQMQHEFASLPSAGFLSQGPGQQQRASVANSVNSVLRTFGVDDKNLPNADAIASTEKLKKLTSYMGFDLARSLGGREPGFIVQQSVGAVPSSENSPLGAQRLIGGLRAVAQRQEDRYKFLTEWSQKSGGDLTGADQAFNTANPPSRYVGQAVLSTVDPRDLAALRANPAYAAAIDKKYGMGTARYALGGQ